MRVSPVVALVVVAVGCGTISPDMPGAGGGTHSATGGGNGSTGGGSSGRGGGAQPGAVRTELYTAGSRLKVRSLVGTDGSRQQVGLWDSQRNEACGFVLASDGRMRCLPFGEAVTSVYYFTDASCSTPAFLVSSVCSAPKYGIVYRPTNACNISSPWSYTVQTVSVSASGTTYYTQYGAGAACTQQQLAADGGVSVYQTGTTIDPGTFVAADYVIE